jgi:hypothetical protein
LTVIGLWFPIFTDSGRSQKRVDSQQVGDVKPITFDRARSAAEKLRSRVVLGESPAEDKKAKRAIPTIAELYRDTYLPHIQSYRRNMESALSFWKVHLLPRFGQKHLDELHRTMSLRHSSLCAKPGTLQERPIST